MEYPKIRNQLVFVGGSDSQEERFQVAKHIRNLHSEKSIIVNSSDYMKEFENFAKKIYGDNCTNDKFKEHYQQLIQQPLNEHFISIVKNMYETLNINIVATAPFDLAFSDEEILKKIQYFSSIHNIDLKLIYINKRNSSSSLLDKKRVATIKNNEDIFKISPMPEQVDKTTTDKSIHSIINNISLPFIIKNNILPRLLKK